MSELRDFLYLDTAKLHSFVSQIHGGLISVINEKFKQLGGVSAGLTVGLTPVGGKVDASKSKESERQQTLQLTDPAYFNVLYQYLKQKKDFTDVSSLDMKKREKLEIGQFVEIQGMAEPPVVEAWIERIRKLFSFFERNMKLIGKQSKGKSTQKISNMQMREFKALLDFLEDYVNISRKDPGKQYIQVSTGDEAYKIWCGLLPEYANISLNTALPANVFVFGRVERLLSDEEIYKIVDFSQFSQSAGVSELLDVLNSFSVVIGQKEIVESDLQAQYPDLFITPVGIYR